MMALRTILKAACVAALSLAIAGCATETSVARKAATYEEAANNPFVPANYRAAEALLGQLQGKLSPDQPMIIATVVSIDALERSSTLGRLVSEHVSARFSQGGHKMVEMKFRNNVYMVRDQGEMMLTREIRDIAKSHDAQAVIVGTYGESSDFIFVNLKVIDPGTNVALAVHDYALPVDANTKAMLRAAR
ncbi:FlgO family outer membrane protein [Parazoarcus communis]|nr:FlgO family outer membrane protein [Parazoarcus communis]